MLQREDTGKCLVASGVIYNKLRMSGVDMKDVPSWGIVES